MNGGGKKNEEREKKPRKTRERKIAKKKRRFSIDTRYTYTLVTHDTHRKQTEETPTLAYILTRKKKKKKKNELTYKTRLHESTCNSKIIVLRTFCDNY